jgi:uroporphyrin-III C-methyltransferase/precorrin-2 dehydrogenase/sirohydrochlorin ferrochelatase
MNEPAHGSSPSGSSAALYPVFLRLNGRRVLLVGGGPVATSKLQGLLDAGALITVVAPEVTPEIEAAAAARSGEGAEAVVTIEQRPFVESDLDGAWFVVAAATREVNREVSRAAEARALFVNAVDDPPNATAYLGGIVRRAGVTLAISTDGKAPALAGLLREALDALLPRDLDRWMEASQAIRQDWLAQRVPMEERRPLLLRRLNELYEQRAPATLAQPADAAHPQLSDAMHPQPADAADPQPADAAHPRLAAAQPPAAAAAHGKGRGPAGFVSLVGAGPGDPALLTQRAAQRLAEADLVLYDALVSPEVLPLASRAQRLSVGKRACKPSISQEAINRCLIRAAQRGRRVVRLKCGDPFVFGRGGEEALALASAGVPFEVVPGVSSALAAPALTGIPVTHRGLSSSFVVVSGHSESVYQPLVDALAPQSTTLVVLMGLGSRAKIAARLLARGWSGTTPAAVLLSVATPAAETWIGTLDELAAGQAVAHAQPGEVPGTLVIGEVVSLAYRLGAVATPAPADGVDEALAAREA